MSKEEDLARQLRKNYLFMSLDDKDIIDLARLFEVVKYNVGEVVIEQGMFTVKLIHVKPTIPHDVFLIIAGETEEEGYYYLLVEGECSVFKNG